MKILFERMLLFVCRVGDAFIRRPSIPVLLYHSISDAKTSLAVPPQEFEAQLSYLQKKNFLAISPGEIFSALQKRKKAVLITFDDGLRDNLAVAHPLLAKRGFSATLFVASSYIGKHASFSTHATYQNLPMLSSGEVSELEEKGWCIGSHGAIHANYPELSNEAISEDIRRAKNTLTPLLQQPSTLGYFALPRNRCDARVRSVLQKEGITLAFAGTENTATYGENPLSIPRIGIHPGISMERFALLFSPTYHRLKRIWRRF